MTSDQPSNVASIDADRPSSMSSTPDRYTYTSPPGWPIVKLPEKIGLTSPVCRRRESSASSSSSNTSPLQRHSIVTKSLVPAAFVMEAVS